jgi:NAD+ kinase
MTDAADGSTRVGVVGSETAPAVDAFETVGARPVVASAHGVLDADPDIVAAVGEAALLSVARQRPSVPVLPVDAGRGVRSVPQERLGDAATRVVAGNWSTDSHPLLAVDVGGDRQSLALMDAMAVTAEPAHISEFTLRTEDERIAQFRADGVVAAAPAGTPGYARAAGAPVVPPGPSVLTLVPVAPFATTLDHWVVPATTLTMTVERDDATVEVLADDRTVGIADVGEPVTLAADGTVETVRVPEGVSPFGRGGSGGAGTDTGLR